jgi:hypothetical protein
MSRIVFVFGEDADTLRFVKADTGMMETVEMLKQLEIQTYILANIPSK